MIKHRRGEGTTSSLLHSRLTIPRVPVTSAKIKCGRGLAKDFISLQDSHMVLQRKSFFKNASNDQFRWGKAYDLS